MYIPAKVARFSTGPFVSSQPVRGEKVRLAMRDWTIIIGALPVIERGGAASAPGIYVYCYRLRLLGSRACQRKEHGFIC